MKTPAYYVAPLRSRAQITAWLLACSQSYYEDRARWIFAFNVKAHRLDLSFDNLLAAATAPRYSHDSAMADSIRDTDPVWLAAARELYTEHADSLFEWGREDACNTFAGRKGQHYGKPDDDGFNMIWDGTPVDVEFAFFGRSGGWLTLTHFDGHALTSEGRELGAEALAELPFATLRKLYRFVVMLTADLARHDSAARIEEAAAWAFFVNICEPENLDNSDERAEKAHWEARDTVTV